MLHAERSLRNIHANQNLRHPLMLLKTRLRTCHLLTTSRPVNLDGRF